MFVRDVKIKLWNRKKKKQTWYDRTTHFFALLWLSSLAGACRSVLLVRYVNWRRLATTTGFSLWNKISLMLLLLLKSIFFCRIIVNSLILLEHFFMSSSFEVFSITTLSLFLIVVIVAILATYTHMYVCVYIVQRIEDDTGITHDTMKQIIYIEQLISFFWITDVSLYQMAFVDRGLVH